MRRVSRKPVSTHRFGWGFVVNIMLMIGLSVFLIGAMRKISSLTGKLYRHPFAVSGAVLSIESKIVKMHRSMKDVVLARDVHDVQLAQQEVEHYEARVHEDFAIIEKRFLGDHRRIRNAKQTFEAWKPIRDEVLALAISGDRDNAANITKGKGARHVARLHETLARFTEFAENKAAEFLSETRRTEQLTLSVAYVTVALSIILGVFLSLRMYVGFNRDIAERQESERALQQAKDAAVMATRSKNLFLANMSHEIRTPMNGVLGMTELLLLSPLSADQRENAEAIEHCGQSLLVILNDVLDLSKIEAGKMVLEQADFKLGKLLKIVTHEFSKLAWKRGLDFQVALSPDLPERVRGDSHRLFQILRNLLSNALKFTRQGEIRLAVDAQSRADGVLASFHVHDTGLGIDAGRLRDIFRPFTQEDASTTREFGGTGLGLAISKQLAELMGGEIRAESQRGRGSVFTVSVPLGRALEAVDPRGPSSALAEEGTAQPHAGVRALLVEDDTINRKVLGKMFALLGLDVACAYDGEQALTKLDEAGYDIVFMDCHMPKLDGYEATRRFRERESVREKSRRLPIIALTANAFAEDRDKCLAAGMDDHLAKPLNLQALRRTLHCWLEPDGGGVNAWRRRVHGAHAMGNRTAPGGSQSRINTPLTTLEGGVGFSRIL